MGKYGKAINSIKTHGYGTVFDWSSNVLSKNNTWEEYLDRELKIHEIFEFYEKHNILTHKNFKKFIYAFDEIREWDFVPTLSHGDLLLKNLIVNKQAEIVSVIDWETAISTKGVVWEFSKTIYSLRDEEKKLFLDGYGMREKEFKELFRWAEIFNVAIHSGHFRWALREGLKDEVERKSNDLNEVMERV